MTENELQQYLRIHFPKESSSCEWKEFKNLKHFVNGHEGDDIISYISAIANMEGGLFEEQRPEQEILPRYDSRGNQ